MLCETMKMVMRQQALDMVDHIPDTNDDNRQERAEAQFNAFVKDFEDAEAAEAAKPVKQESPFLPATSRAYEAVKTEDEPAPMTAAEALAAAEAEGLTLERAKRGCKGFKDVKQGYKRDASGNEVTKRFTSSYGRGPQREQMGPFATPEEAALARARKRVPMTKEEAEAKAKEEGLELLRDGDTRYMYVTRSATQRSVDRLANLVHMQEPETSNGNLERWLEHYREKPPEKPYEATVRHRDGTTEKLGSFRSEHEAALEVARALGPEENKSVLAHGFGWRQMPRVGNGDDEKNSVVV
jgi:hypothetical protein